MVFFLFKRFSLPKPTGNRCRNCIFDISYIIMVIVLEPRDPGGELPVFP